MVDNATPAPLARTGAARRGFWMRAVTTFVAAAALSAGGVALATTAAQAYPVTITNGVLWPDQNGNNVQGHGGSIIKVGSEYYWFGEDKEGENDSDAYFQHIPCYASSDLTNWTFIAEALSQQSSGDLGPDKIVERPKVIYNSGTGQYVMYMHIDVPGYSEGKVGVATSSNVCGPYNYLGSFLPMGYQSWDIGLFKDSNGTAYLLSHSSNSQLHIYQLSSDYTTVSSLVASISTNNEAPAMFYANGTYFLFSSNQTGWNFNDNVYATASSISGPWSSFQTFAPTGSFTYNSQVDQILPIQGSSGTTYMYMGDRWNAGNLGNSTYVWLPLNVSGSSVSLPNYYDTWSVDVAAGTWSGSPSNPSPTTIVGAQSGLCLDDPGNYYTTGKQMDIYTCNGQSNQSFTYEWGNLRYSNGNCLDVYGDGRTAGTIIDTWACNGGGDQQWELLSNGTIVATESGLCLDVAGQATAPGSGVDIWTCNGQQNQQWQWSGPGTPPSPPPATSTTLPASTTTTTGPSGYPSGYHQLVVDNDSLCVDVYDNSTSNGASIDQWSCKTSGQGNQELQFNAVSNGYGELQNQNSGKDIVVQSASKSAGAKVIQYTQNGTTNGLWLPIQLSNGSWQFRNENSGLCLDVTGAVSTLGTQLDQWYCKSSAAGTNQGFATR